MIDLQPAPVPELTEEWIVSHRTVLVDALSHGHRRPLRWTVLAGATGVAVTTSTLVLVGGSGQYAFAGWSASPTTPAGGQLSAADAVCQARLANLPQPLSTKGADAAPVGPLAPFVPELSDVRGPYTVTVFANGARSAALCISTPDSTSLRWVMGSGAPVATGAVAVDQVSVLAREGQPYTLVEGRTGDGVTGVILALGNGTRVTATTGHGLFVAWWPGSQDIASASVSTATGVSTQTLSLPGPRIPPPPASKWSPPPPSTPAP